MTKILTVCAQGLVRSVALADVLKLHFEPVDVIPVGHKKNANSAETLRMLCDWSDWIIVMQPHYQQRLEKRLGLEHLQNYYRILCCDVGKDTYGHSHNPVLIDKVWRWARGSQQILGIKEHRKRL